jgi:HEAT repeat protein
MRERLPVIAALTALGVAVVLGFWMRHVMLRPPDSEPLQTASAAPESGRSARVEERLQMLRESYARRQQEELAASARAAPGTDSASAPVAAAPPGTSGAQDLNQAARGHASWHAHSAGAAPTPQPQRAAAPPAIKRFHGFLAPAFLDKETSTDKLEETITNGTDPTERIKAIDELTSVKEPEDALRILTSVLLQENLDPAVYAAVLEGLSDFTDDLTAEMITPALHSENPQVRFQAVALLGDMDTVAAHAAVKGAVSDPDPEVSELARGILEIGG